ncbi:MAG: histidine kinase [Pseudomonadota bacterium]
MLGFMQSNAGSSDPSLSVSPQESVRDLPNVWWRGWSLAVFFVVLWPTFNLLVVAAILNQFGFYTTELIQAVALRLYFGFSLAYCGISLLQRLLPMFRAVERFWPQWLLHIGVFVTINQSLGPVPGQLGPSDPPGPLVLPTAYMFFQISLFVVAKTLLVQRDRHLAMELTLRQAQINTLRSQSNPHFLFNTLNLLASEIGRNPASAEEMVYDLADLLRDSMRAAEREFSTLEEELRLVRLYLTLQKKRFPDRLEYQINAETDSLPAKLPSLLLQPIVENVVKHVVAKSSAVTQLRITSFRKEGRLTVEVRDNGPPVTALNNTATGGLRIVEETLALHYLGEASLQLQSDVEGACVTIVLPERQAGT